MVINEAGTYTLVYTATDECGNTTTVEREVVVSTLETYRTVLYTDGTLIINEGSNSIDANVAEHGEATNIYDPLDADHPYVFTVDMEQQTTDIPWFSELQSITSVEIGSAIQPTDTKCWFFHLHNCTSIDLSLLDTSNVTNMSYMFYDCSALTSLDVSSFNTGNVTDMNNMFYDCSALTSLDVSSFNTGNVTDMWGMFSGCSALTSIDLSTFDTGNVTNIGNMFESCEALTSIDVSSFNTSNVTNMDSMFSSCSALTNLDVSSFNTGNVTDMSYMFGYCSALTTIIASANFVTTNVSNSDDMFSNDTNLVGGNGTVYDSTKTDKTYARIDTAGTLGYFTASA